MNLSLRIANYITRYAPSDKRIRMYLTKKKCQNIDALLEQVGYNELLMCTMWMRSFIAIGKWEREIRMKLMKKEFPKSLIDEMTANFAIEVHDWESNRHAIERQIHTLESRAKSKRVIYGLLISKYPYFRDEITTLMEETSDTASLEREVEKYKSRYNLWDQKEKQKFYAAILRKGFKYDDIKRMMED